VDLLRFALLGLGIGSAYALAGLGLVLTYRGSRVVNFAHGAIGMIAAFVFYDLRDERGIGAVASMPIAVLVSAAIGATFYVVVIRALQSAPAIAKMIASLGLLVFLQAVALEIWNADLRLVPPVLPNERVDLTSSVALGRDRLYLCVLGLLCTLCLGLFYRRTRFGLATTAVAEHDLSAAALGWSPNVIAAANWAAGGALAGLAAVLLAPVTGLSVSGLSLLVVPAMAAALAGGFRSFYVTTLTALAIGAAQSIVANKLSVMGITDSLPLLVIVAVLVARGSTLPARHEARAERLPMVGDGIVRPRYILPPIILAAAAILTVTPIWVDAFTTTLVMAIITLSLVVVSGYCGQLSLAQFALAGFGAFVAVRAANRVDGELLLALVVAVAATILVSLVVAVPALRTRGVTLAITTMGLAAAIDGMILQSPSLGGGIGGLDVERAHVLGLDIDGTSHPERYGLLCLACLVLAALVVANLRRGATGRRMLAVRSNERAAASLGINIVSVKLFAFSVGGALAGLGGVLLALRSRHPNMSGYGLIPSVNVVVFAVLGGIGLISGAMVAALAAPGALLFRAFSESATLVHVLAIVSGLGTMVNVVHSPDGIAHRIAHLRRRAKGTGTPPSPHAEPRRPDTTRPARPTPPRVSDRQVVLRASSMTVRYGGIVAADAVDLSVGSGEILGLIGPNGAGKSTVIDAITGFTPLAGGTVCVGEKALTGWSPSRIARAGVVRTFQSVDLFNDLTVLDNIRAGAENWSNWQFVTGLLRPNRSSVSHMAHVAIDVLELEHLLHLRPTELSYGQRRLVAIARALATGPLMLLLDEPAAGLDPTETSELGSLLRAVASLWGVGILLVEHDVEMVMAIADRVTVLDFGSVIAQGEPPTVRDDPAVVAAYLGTDAQTPVPSGQGLIG
jgi:ABC-type branched-subunit amino acid transport system ATPase component/branched-subunit amino acid ABC-type transport system permease component